MARGAWQATVHGVAKSGHDLVTKQHPFCSLFSEGLFGGEIEDKGKKAKR